MSLPVLLAQLLPEPLLTECALEYQPAGTHLFLTGQRPRWMFFVHLGEVVLERHSQNGQVTCLQRSHCGFVGEASLTSSRYHCDGRATRDSQLIKMPIGALRTYLQTDAAFSGRWIEMLSREVRHLRLQNERLALPRVQDRLIHLIETEGAGRYSLPSSLKELARQLAVSHEALYRTIAQLETAGILMRQDGQLVLMGMTC